MENLVYEMASTGQWSIERNGEVVLTGDDEINGEYSDDLDENGNVIPLDEEDL